MIVDVGGLEIHTPPVYPSACVLLGDAAGAGWGPLAEAGQQKRELVLGPGASTYWLWESGQVN